MKGRRGGVILSAYFTIPVDILRVEPNLNGHDVEMKGTLVNLCWTRGLFARITIRYWVLTINATNANALVDSSFLIVEPEG